MAQLSYNTFPNTAFAGLIADPSFVKNVRSYSALKPIDFGKALVWVADGENGYVKEFEQNLTVETVSATLVTGNVINANVNGVAISPVTFATNHADTMAALAAAIEAASTDVLSASVTATDVITIVKNPAVQSVKVTGFVVTGGAGQPTVAETYSTNEVPFAVSVRENLEPVQIGAANGYQANDSVNSLTEGSIWVNVLGTVSQQSGAVYAYADQAVTGILTSNPSSVGSGSGVQITSSVFRSSAANALAEISFHIP